MNKRKNSHRLVKRLCAYVTAIIMITMVALFAVGCVPLPIWPSGSGNGGTDNNGSGGSASGNTAYIGDTVLSGDIRFKVNGVSDTNRLGGEYFGDETEYNFLVIDMTITNTGNSEVSLTSSYFRLKLGEAKYEPVTGTIYLDNGFYISERVGAGLSKNIIIAFETPTKSDESTYVLSVKGGSFKTEQDITLKQK